MGVIASQNWDGVTAPALPAGWSYAARLLTSTAFELSSPNALSLAATSSTAMGFATYDTLDGAAGNVIVSASFYLDPYVGGTASCGVTARASATSISQSSGSFYMAWVNFVSGQCNLSNYVSGTATVMANSYIPVVVSAWYTIFLACNGSNITMSVQRLADGYWYSSASGWVPTVCDVLAVVDSTITGQGYSGLMLDSDTYSGATWYSDNWSLSATPTPVYPPIYVAPTVYPRDWTIPGFSRP